MSTTYVGQQNWILVQPPQVTRNLFGTDVVSVRLGGKTTTLPQTLSLFSKGRNFAANSYLTAKGFNFPWAYLTDISVQSDKAFSYIELTYKGIASTTLPDPKPEAGVRLQSVSLPYVGDIIGETTGAVATFDYHAPYTKWTYVTRGMPRNPKVRRILITKSSLNVLNRSGSPGTLKLFRGKSVTRSVFNGEAFGGLGSLNAYNGLVEGIYASFDYNEIGNNLWECTQVNEVRIVPLDLVNSGFFNALN